MTEGAYSIPMAIVDFLPVLFYFLASWLIARDLYNKTSKTAFALLASGSIMVFIGGAFKALWKLLFCFGINYPFFFACFFPMQVKQADSCAVGSWLLFRPKRCTVSARTR